MNLEFFGSLLSFGFNTVVILYWIVTAVILLVIARSTWQLKWKLLLGLPLAVVMIGWPIKQEVERRADDAAMAAKATKANAIFEERCKTAGENIHRTVEGVEGVLIMKGRPSGDLRYKGTREDPYGDDSSGDNYFAKFLHARNEKGHLVQRMSGAHPGYRYVDFVDKKDGIRYRYTGYMGVRPQSVGTGADPTFQLKREVATGPAPRYGVTYDDIATPEERALWIAGSSLKVVDLQTNEVIAERVGYMIDKGMGDTGGGRQPWAYAQETEGWSCPKNTWLGQTRNFVEKVLKIKE